MEDEEYGMVVIIMISKELIMSEACTENKQIVFVQRYTIELILQTWL